MYKNPIVYKYTTRLPNTGATIPVLGLDDGVRTRDIVANLTYNGTYCPDISRVTTNTKTVGKRPVLGEDGKPLVDKAGNPVLERYPLGMPVFTTIVEFADKTKCVMTCSEHDKPDTETAIVNAIVKRLMGKVDPDTGLVDSNGCGLKLKKMASNAIDASRSKAEKAEAKAQKKAEHESRQKAEHEAAHQRKVAKVAKELQTTLEALKLLGIDYKNIASAETAAVVSKALETAAPSVKTLSNSKTLICEKSGNKCTCKDEPKNACHCEYKRPDKKFKDFTQEEKRAYWRNANKNRSK